MESSVVIFSAILRRSPRSLTFLPSVRPEASLNKSPKFSSNPFTLSVASGDPEPDGVVIWTRLAPKPLEAGGGMTPEAVETRWEVAEDEAFTKVVKSGTAPAMPQLGHSVHVEVNGLEPHRWYFYRFHAGEEGSPVGRTRTTPQRNILAERLRFAFTSCQHYETGYYDGYLHMQEEDLDLVVHLGDYIYEGAAGNNRPRKHIGKECESLDEYRIRYAQLPIRRPPAKCAPAFPLARDLGRSRV